MFLKRLCGVISNQLCCYSSKIDQLQMITHQSNAEYPGGPQSDIHLYLDKTSLNNSPRLLLTIIDSQKLEIGSQFEIGRQGLLGSSRSDGSVYGGTQNCDISLSPQQLGAGPLHFVIQTAQQGFSIQDLGQGSGTFIRLDKPLTLTDKSVISIGDSNLVVTLPYSLKSSIQIRFIDGPKTNQLQQNINSEFTQQDDPILIGRKPDCKIRFDDSSLSRYQALISFVDSQWVFQDGDGNKLSTNGSWLFAEEPTTIQEGMVFKTAQTLFKCNLNPLELSSRFSLVQMVFKNNSTQSLTNKPSDNPLALTSSLKLKSLRSESKLQKLSDREDRYAVLSLDIWDNQEVDSDCIRQLQEAFQALNRRINNQNLVEAELMKRKKLKVPIQRPAYKPSSLQQQKMTRIRLQKIRDQEFQEIKQKSFKKYENELASTFQKLEKDFEFVRETMISIRNENAQHREELEQIKRALNKLKQNFMKKSRVKRPQQGRNNGLWSKYKLLEQNNRRQAAFLHDREILQRDIARNINRLQSLEIEAQRLKNQIELVKSAQIHHYTQILKIGHDCRTEGLMWVVKSLWNYGFEVKPDHFPGFLDQICVNNILRLASISQEIQRLSQILSVQTYNQSTPTHRGRWNGIKDRLKSLSKTVRVKKPQYTIDFNTNSLRVDWENCSSQFNEQRRSADTLLFILSVESQIKENKEMIVKIQDSEVSRLATNFALNGYQKKYRVSLKQVLAALLGYERTERYSAYISKLTESLSKEIASVKTFNFFQK